MSTLYVFPFTQGTAMYFSSAWVEEPEQAAHRLFKMHEVQFNSLDPTQNFFEVNTDLRFDLHSCFGERMVMCGRQYIFTREGGLIAQFYDLKYLQWNTFFAGPWHLFVNRFGGLSEWLYPFRLCKTEVEDYYLTLEEAQGFIEDCKGEPLGYTVDVELLNTQIETFKKRRHHE